MTKTTLYLPEDLQRRLKEAAGRLGRSQADLVRAALETYLDSHRPEMPRSVGMTSGVGVNARDAKRWVREQWSGKWDSD